MLLIYAYLGGLLLNLMPCVLPVVSLKVMGLADHRSSYVLGILFVFAILATLSVTMGLAWGQQFNYPWFAIAMTAVTFAMGLSYLGVWEIPQPAFEIKKQGSFARGVMATLLATPCSGPLLGPVFAWTLGKSVLQVYTTFMLVGLGMATPYLLPIKLPKPGAWMERFKQLAGFMLVGTSIWLLYSVADRYLFSTVMLLYGIAFGCWLKSWPGLVSAVAIGLFAFSSTPTVEQQPYSIERLQQLRSENRIVLVQFTARWCLTCQMNDAVLNGMQQDFDRLNVTLLRAEVKYPGDEAAKMLRALGYDSVPMLAAFPPKGEPISLPDLVSRRQVINALEVARGL